MGLFGKYNSAEEIPPEERKYYYMGDKYRKVEEIEFVSQVVNGLWTVRLPKFLAEYHSWWPVWEKECHLSMAAALKPGMLLYDVGAFDGWQSAMFSQMVGGAKNMVLVEPVPEMWPNTKATWEQNGLEPPRASFMGFASDVNFDPPNQPLAAVYRDAWPEGPDYSQMIKAIKFRLIHEHGEITPSITLDKLAQTAGVPDAIHIDVEGAGLKVLRGAVGLLTERKPIVWIAIHPPFMIERFNTQPAELHSYMKDRGYAGKLLADDHEQHWVFEKAGL
jgi:FkbM family methyltransferase